MSYAQTLWYELQSGRTTMARPNFSGGLLGIVLLCMLCVTETEWLLKSGAPDAVNIVAAAEGIHFVE
jgi:hypothetical protein